MAIWQTLKSAIVGVGVGEATADAMTPILTPAAQDAWSKNPYKALAASVAAELVAQGLTDIRSAAEEASLSGTNEDRLTALVQAAMTAPGVPEALILWRRGEITEDAVTHALRKSMLEPQWDAALKGLKDNYLTPQQVALGIVRSTVADPGLLAVTLNTADSNVSKYPVYPGDALTEAAAGGIDEDRLRVMVGEIGLPMAAIAAAQATFRGILTKGAYYQAILEGDVRPEWADPYFEYARQIPTAHDFIEQRLRGWTDDAGMYAGTARHGISEADTFTLFQIAGRPISAHQVFVGLLRGGTYDGQTDMIDPAYLKALQESNIRPEWYNLLWHGRYTYPSPFVTKALAQAGDLTYEQTLQILTYEAWEPTLAVSVATSWTGGKATTTSPHVKSAQTAVLAAAKKAYVGGSLTPADATARLTASGISPSDAAAILAQWNLIAQIEGTNIDTAGGTPH